MDKKFYDQTKYDAAKKRHPEGTPRIEESYAPRDHVSIKEQEEIREIREQMTKMMDRISVLDKEKETPAKKERELNELNSAMSDTQGTSDLNQLEKLQTIIIRIHKSSGDTKEMVTTVKAPRDEKKSCNQKSSKFGQVQPKIKGGSHLDTIPISYKELYEKLLEARKVDPYYIKPFQPPYPNWYNINVYCKYHAGAQGHTIENCLAFKRRLQSLLDQGILQFMINDQPSLVIEDPVRSTPNVFKGNTPEEWITGVTKLKKNCNIHEGRAKKFYHNSRVAEEICKTSVSELKRCQVENQRLNSAMTNMEASYHIHQLEIDTELKATMAKNKTLKKCLDDYRDLMKEKDNIMKEATAQANNVAHKPVDLASFTRELKQIENSTPEHEWKLVWLLREIEKLGVKAIPYM
ncbi:hypothetical protein F3Y22_tig00110391pilonHSYRG00166 [Hibiscus syriacus]|uniref:Uncharacterized protein n=1 Tax=Hibiscus syriacus TaxID=106335 RepID=A0A6A3AS87_HIBSY|nr:hypothetical protein F3Y22_tig00110391pilonHSYRG00166 [Hibiscus syriacus]